MLLSFTTSAKARSASKSGPLRIFRLPSTSITCMADGICLYSHERSEEMMDA
ncbi:hypothetical protein N803_06455 [Knoellia subterranea KCTC 19937]|uniref:Uncharacterized protein n=1 Tax=Knoellia subterranea KCTC 19937 TaxID=1385521 RepID=A0A0A0JFP2_9MICO|nr:hypothetical protein N803_06455 [Knoellia subterranea KCTC 19937]